MSAINQCPIVTGTSITVQAPFSQQIFSFDSLRLLRGATGMQLLVAEDDLRLARLLEQGLTEDGHRVTLAYDGQAALEMAQSHPFDAIVLDIMMPRTDGLTVAHRLRASANQTPLLMLTARDSESDIVKALNIGADDYLVKPFSFEVLIARLRAISRRGPIAQPVCLNFAGLTLNTSTRQVTRGSRAISLTPREHSLLELLLRNAGRVVTRDTILDSVWGFDTDVNENTLEAFVRLLRQKVDQPPDPKLIHTVRGIGYGIRLPDPSIE
jgi:two-component system, OmpR family, response regulator MprA